MSVYTLPNEGFFQQSAPVLATGLLGGLLARRWKGGWLTGVIIETEAYTEDDPASHSFRGESSRNRSMFRKGGHAYVYLIYGIHHCFNVTAGTPGSGEAVLVRALKPRQGLRTMMENRGRTDPEELCSGPGRLCRALGISLVQDGTDLRDGEIRLFPRRLPVKGNSIDVTERIGISKGRRLKRRYLLVQ